MYARDESGVNYLNVSSRILDLGGIDTLWIEDESTMVDGQRRPGKRMLR